MQQSPKSTTPNSLKYIMNFSATIHQKSNKNSVVKLRFGFSSPNLKNPLLNFWNWGISFDHQDLPYHHFNYPLYFTPNSPFTPKFRPPSKALRKQPSKTTLFSSQILSFIGLTNWLMKKKTWIWLNLGFIAFQGHDLIVCPLSARFLHLFIFSPQLKFKPKRVKFDSPRFEPMTFPMPNQS